MPIIYYKRREQPGCGGCFLLILLILLLSGGAPFVLNFLGFLLFSGLTFVLLLIAAFWGFSYYVRSQVSRYEQSQTESHNRFVALLVHILMKIAMIDGVVTKAETTTIVDFFRLNLNYTQTKIMWIKELIKEAQQTQVSLDDLLVEFKSRFAYEPRLILVELIYRVIFTKAQIPPHELDLAKKIADFLDISFYDQEAIRARYFMRARQTASSDEEFYRTLGLEPGADFEQIKKAYRKLSMQYHPDKVSHLGEEFRKVAEEKMKEINRAYQHLKEKSA